jgi:hypothetical protein
MCLFFDTLLFVQVSLIENLAFTTSDRSTGAALFLTLSKLLWATITYKINPANEQASLV